jgi:hypothetical protein
MSVEFDFSVLGFNKPQKPKRFFIFFNFRFLILHNERHFQLDIFTQLPFKQLINKVLYRYRAINQN